MLYKMAMSTHWADERGRAGCGRGSVPPLPEHEHDRGSGPLQGREHGHGRESVPAPLLT